MSLLRRLRQVWPPDWIRTLVSRPRTVVTAGPPERTPRHTGAPSPRRGARVAPRATPARCSAAARPGAVPAAPVRCFPASAPGSGSAGRARRRRRPRRTKTTARRLRALRRPAAWRLLFDPLVLVLRLGARRERSLPGRPVAAVRCVLVGGRV